MKHPLLVQSLLSNLRNGWRRFWVMPEQYWNIAVIACSFFLALTLLADVWIFWKFAWELENNVADPHVSVQSLDRAKFDAVLKSLHERELKFNAMPAQTSIENIFD